MRSLCLLVVGACSFDPSSAPTVSADAPLPDPCVSFSEQLDTCALAFVETLELTYQYFTVA